MSLYTYLGVLLNINGSLAAGPNCCCSGDCTYIFSLDGEAADPDAFINTLSEKGYSNIQYETTEIGTSFFTAECCNTDNENCELIDVSLIFGGTVQFDVCLCNDNPPPLTPSPVE